MYYEDVKVKAGQTVSGLVMAYGHAAGAWQWTWNDPKNAALVQRRGKPESLQAGDTLMIPIPWHVTAHPLNATPNGAHLIVRRNGGFGTQLNWVQTLDQGNQPSAGFPRIAVDATPPDDDLPFYWTNNELQHHADFRKMFEDYPSRPTPPIPLTTTKWRGTVAIAVVTDRRVTVFDAWVWGFDRAPDGTVTTVGPRQATPQEATAQLKVLEDGRGTLPGTFKTLGWTFRTPP